MSQDSKETRGSEDARAWASELAEAFGKAVRVYRENLNLSAVQLSNRTREQGYPITRATIAKIESNSRSSKIDVAEILTLAAALEVSPRDLMFSGYPKREFRAIPRVKMTVEAAEEWFCNSFGYNEYDGLHQPKLTQTKVMETAIEDFNRAKNAMLTRYSFEKFPRSNSWQITAPSFTSANELAPWIKTDLEMEYEQLKSLQEKVIRLGGFVDLPPWFGTTEVIPF